MPSRPSSPISRRIVARREAGLFPRVGVRQHAVVDEAPDRLAQHLVLGGEVRRRRGRAGDRGCGVECGSVHGRPFVRFGARSCDARRLREILPTWKSIGADSSGAPGTRIGPATSPASRPLKAPCDRRLTKRPRSIVFCSSFRSTVRSVDEFLDQQQRARATASFCLGEAAGGRPRAGGGGCPSTADRRRCAGRAARPRAA